MPLALQAEIKKHLSHDGGGGGQLVSMGFKCMHKLDVSSFFPLELSCDFLE